MRNYYVFVGVLSALVIALVTASFSIMGNPLDQKLKAQDDVIISDFNNISSSITTYYNTSKQLPRSLTDIDTIYGVRNLSKYQYKIITTSSYNLCATFMTDTKNSTTPPPFHSVTNVTHSKGSACILYKLPAYMITPIPPRLTETDNILTASCAGEIENSMCILPGCSYTYPIDIYTKGKAVDSTGNNFYNSCGGGQQVYVQYCATRFDSSSYNHAAYVFNCPLGCQNGACTK